MNLIGKKQKQIRQIGERLKRGAEIGLKVGREAGRSIQTCVGEIAKSQIRKSCDF